MLLERKEKEMIKVCSLQINSDSFFKDYNYVEI